MKARKKEIGRYIIKRIITGIFLLFILSVLIYGLVRLMPGDYVQNSIAGNARITSEAKERMIENYGLSMSVPEGYCTWISNGLSGDFGISFLYKKSVTDVIASGIGITLLISCSALIFQILISLWIGINAAFQRHKAIRRIAAVFSVLSVSTPVFFVALLLQKWLALDLGLLPLQGQISLKYDYSGIMHVLDLILHLLIPVLTLVITGSGYTIKYIKERTEAVLASEYVLSAVSRGFGEKEIIKQQVLPNIRVLLAVIIGREIPGLLTKTLIIEEIFVLNGVGTIVFAGLSMADIPLIMGFSMLVAILVVICAIAEDVLYALSDPRIRLGKGVAGYERQ